MLTIAQISDCHLFADTNLSPYAQINPYHSLSRVLLDVALHKLDLLLVTGDLSGDGSALSYHYFKQLMQDSGISCPYVILPGNHDDLDILQQQFDAENLWLAYGDESGLSLANWQIHLLNTKVNSSSGGALPSQDLQQLERALHNSPADWQLIAAHHHPLPCNAWMDKHSWHNASELVTMLARYPSVKGLVHGHIHHASQQLMGECCYMSCPSTCWQWAMQAQFGLCEQPPGYRLLELAQSGQISSQIIRVE